MPPDSNITHNDMLMSSDWSSFFKGLAQSHLGRPVEIEQDGDLLLINPAGAGAPLQGIELRSGHRRKELIIKTTTQTCTIESPNLIWTVRNEQDELVAVEIEDGSDHKFILRFV